ncbi:MAG: Jag N-terminal domain-containing protein, partial [Oscillospiraceae bacterium]|nr:Jag N-terminal domain-containing protein [Oscillospiraceae bacterium]
MREIIVTGKTVEEAVLAGCQELGVSRDDLALSYEVLEMPVKKFFKTIPAKVKVVLEEEEAPAAPIAPAKKAEAPKAPEKKPQAPKAEAPKAEPVPVKEEAPKAEAAPAAESEEEVEVEISIEENPKVAAAVEYLRSVFAAMEVEDVTFTAAQKGEATIIHVTGSN